jgi:hypothetical protein
MPGRAIHPGQPRPAGDRVRGAGVPGNLVIPGEGRALTRKGSPAPREGALDPARSGGAARH